MSQRCPHCGQPMLMRHGIRFRAKEVEILDAIEVVSRCYATARVSRTILASTFYPGQSTSKAVKNVAVHVNHINDRLVSTDLKISGGYGGYRLVGRAP